MDDSKPVTPSADKPLDGTPLCHARQKVSEQICDDDLPVWKQDANEAADALNTLSTYLAKLEREAAMLGCINATLLVNFGPQGRVETILKPHDETVINRLVTVLEHLVKEQLEATDEYEA